MQEISSKILVYSKTIIIFAVSKQKNMKTLVQTLNESETPIEVVKVKKLTSLQVLDALSKTSGVTTLDYVQKAGGETFSIKGETKKLDRRFTDIIRFETSDGFVEATNYKNTAVTKVATL